MEKTSQRFKGLCWFQERCRYTAAECRFIHIITEGTLAKAINSMVTEIKNLIKESKSDANKEKEEFPFKNQSQMENASFEEFRDEKAISEPCDNVQTNCTDLLASSNTFKNEDKGMVKTNISRVSKEKCRITMTPNSKRLIDKNPKKRDLMLVEATPMIQQSNIKFIKIQEDYWKSDTGWTCHFCEASFKFEIAFKNHLKNRKECNKDLICLECTKRMKLADLKNHIMIHSPKCSGGSAVLQEHYLKSLTA